MGENVERFNVCFGVGGFVKGKPSKKRVANENLV
jgi:hypothetical protein